MKINSLLTKKELLKLTEKELFELAHSKVKEAIKRTEKTNKKLELCLKTLSESTSN